MAWDNLNKRYQISQSPSQQLVSKLTYGPKIGFNDTTLIHALAMTRWVDLSHRHVRDTNNQIEYYGYSKVPSHTPNNRNIKRQSQFNPNLTDNSSVYHAMETVSTNLTPCRYFDNGYALCLHGNRCLYSHEVIYRNQSISNTPSNQQPKQQDLSTSPIQLKYQPGRKIFCIFNSASSKQ